MIQDYKPSSRRLSFIRSRFSRNPSPFPPRSALLSCRCQVLLSISCVSFDLLPGAGKKELIEWCLKEGLIASSYECPKCNDRHDVTWLAIKRFLLNRTSHAEDGVRFKSCQVIYSQFGLAIHQNDHQARRRFVEWAQNEIAVVPDFHKRILFSDEAHFWLNGYVNKQNCRIWSEANPQVYVETPLHPEKLTVWCALWAGGILLQKR
ncbi:brkDBD domain-containing protein [Trichonephila clavipes]|nr:brkDBD domain-containing protein [Trichonephila clavipes]